MLCLGSCVPRRLSFALLFVWILVSASAKTSSKKRVLVLLESEDLKESHSLFLEDLKANELTPTLKIIDDRGAVLEKHGEYQYSHLILLAPTMSSFGKRSHVKEILEFIDSGRNVVIVGSSKLSKRVFDLAADVGVDFEEPGSRVFDHMHWAKREDGGKSDHGLVVVEPEERVRALFDKRKTSATSRPLLFRGIGHSVAPEHDGVTVAVAGNPTTYAFKKSEKIPEDDALLAGRDVTLVSLIQTSHNARVSVVGSVDFFSDDLFTAKFTTSRQKDVKESGNREFTTDLVLWTFQAIGVLRAERPLHVNANSWTTPQMYNVKDPIHFEINITEWSVDHWQLYRSDDIQLEYYMMAPFIRTCLHDHGNGTFILDLIAPDVYGVFKFLITHRRPGYSNIDITEMAPIRPFRHDEYERFIVTAYPYYASVFSMMVGFWILAILYLYHKER